MEETKQDKDSFPSSAAGKAHDKTERPGIKWGKDGALGKSLAVEHQKLAKHKEPWLPGYILGLIAGAGGTGKSFSLLSIIPKIAKLCEIVVATTIKNNPVYDSLAEYAKSKKIRFTIEDDPANIMDVINTAIGRRDEEAHKKKEDEQKEKGAISGKSKQDERNERDEQDEQDGRDEQKNEQDAGATSDKWILTVWDDWNDGKAGGHGGPYNNSLAHAYTKIRNYNCHCIMIAQDYSSFPTRARTNSNLVILFQQANSFSINNILRDLGNITAATPEDLRDVFNSLKHNRHSFLMASRGSDTDSAGLYVCNKETQMKLARVELETEYDPTEDKDLEKIIGAYDTAPASKINRQLGAYIKFLAAKYGENAADMAKKYISRKK